jgi:hypothetical protein
MNGDWDLEVSTVCFSVQFRPFRGKISTTTKNFRRVDYRKDRTRYPVLAKYKVRVF